MPENGRVDIPAGHNGGGSGSTAGCHGGPGPAADAALAPFRVAIQTRKEEQARQQDQVRQQGEEARREDQRKRDEQFKQFQAQLKLNSLVSRIYARLAELEKNETIETNGFFDLWRTAERFQDKIQPTLVRELIEKPAMPDEEIGRRIEALVGEHLDAVLEA